MKRFRCITFGCRVNQYETQAIREQLIQRGHTEVTDETADLLVVNSCTVTESADRECVSTVRALHKAHPQAAIIVAGCLIQRDAALFYGLPGVRLLVGSNQKHRIADWVAEAENVGVWQMSGRMEVEMDRVYAPLAISEFAHRSKAFVKVQDGCDRSCAFCKIPLVRGRARSRMLSDAREEVQRLLEKGFQEIVLSGVAIGLWGREWKEPRSLADLIRAVNDLPGRFRIRLSSLDPRDLDDRLVETLVSSQRMCHHLHLSLQSGSDAILERMNRGYTSNWYRTRVEALRRSWADLGLTTDLIVGFPGESEEQLQETLRFSREMGFAKVHVFPYSRRKGTSGSFFKDPLPASVVKERARLMRQTAQAISAQFRQRFLGTVQEILVEEEMQEDFWLTGTSGPFVRVAFSGPRDTIGRLVPVTITGVTDEGLVGKFFR